MSPTRRRKRLSLTLYRHWFELIRRGVKFTEYRERTPYWDRRLDGQEFEEVLFVNGYGPDRPAMILECLGIRKTSRNYEINLGTLIRTGTYKELKNHE